MKNKQIPERVFVGARNYALADRSDPFTYNRVMSHIQNDICFLLPNGEAGHYEAEPFQEERTLHDGSRYHVTSYKNVKRP